ncbi:zinc ribbon domain-containing protein YjdM [uncultured Helcococcus sp.]|uniref:zinc ribbon domain-containing protein YjdM n=1 Tax=uncultured Helcococcus sp. TaxID=1072508 RepID=UPI002607B2F2|nr:zinc ribbon domain-containing protein YjdM [uncultured Helcococcus sp.]
MSLPNCPKCGESYTYEDGHLYVCPMCFYEWTEESLKAEEEASILRDSVGNEIYEGADATIIQDLKLSSDTIKRGAKVKGIQILDKEVNGHDIQGKIEGFGNLLLKSSVIKVR